MSKRNMVNVGGIVDPFSGLQRGLSGIAQTFGAQAEREDALAQREFQNDRIRKQDAIAAKDRELLSQVNAFSNKDPNTFVYQLSDYGAEQRDAITNAKKSLTAERDATSRFLSTGSAEDLDRAIDVYSKNLTNLDAPLKEQKIAERRNRLLGFGREALDKGYDTDQRTGRIQELVSGLYDPQFSRIDETIRQGTGLTKEGQFRAFARQLDPSLTSRFSRGELEKKFDSILTAQSRDEILANEQARVAGLNAAKKEQIELNDKFFKTNSKYVGTYKGKRNPKDIFAAYEEIANLDIGTFDNADAISDLTYLLDNNPEMDPMAAAAAIFKNLDRGLTTEEGSDIVKIENDARAISGLDTKKRDVDKDGKPITTSSSSKKETPKLSDYSYTPAQARDLADLLRQRVVLAGGGDYRLGIDDKYLEKVKAAVEELPKTNNTTSKDALGPTLSNTNDTLLPDMANFSQNSNPITQLVLDENLTREVAREQAEMPYRFLTENDYGTINNIQDTINDVEGDRSFLEFRRNARIGQSLPVEVQEQQIAEIDQRLANLKIALNSAIGNPSGNLLDMDPREQALTRRAIARNKYYSGLNELPITPVGRVLSNSANWLGNTIDSLQSSNYPSRSQRDINADLLEYVTRDQLYR